MWSNMWSKAILDQSRGEVKKKKCQRRNGFSDWLISRVQTVLQHPKQARYQLRYTRLFSLFIRLGVFSQSTRPTNWAIPGFCGIFVDLSLLILVQSGKEVKKKKYRCCSGSLNEPAYFPSIRNKI